MRIVSLLPLRGAARVWVERMPASLRDTFLNPFVIAEIRV